MRLRLVTLPDGRDSVAVRRGDEWIPLRPALGDVAADVVTFLAAGEEARSAAEEVEHEPVAPEARLPFVPRTFRDFSLWERHMEDAARVLVRRFFPPPVARAMAGFERVTGRTFPPLRPKGLFHEHPVYYLGNHTTFAADGEPVAWPGYSEFVDYELELGFVLARAVKDASPEEGEAAIGGFVVVNDFSARDAQAEEARRGIFGPVIKAKGFANAMSAEVVTADEVLPRWDRLAGEVRVNGELWSRGTTAGARHGLGDMVAYASLGEPLAPGDLLATGTLPGCCGMELDRWLTRGDEVALSIEGVGSVTNRVG